MLERGGEVSEVQRVELRERFGHSIRPLISSEVAWGQQHSHAPDH